MLGVKTPTFDMELGVHTFNFQNFDKFKLVKSIEVDLQADAASSFKVELDDSQEQFSKQGGIKIKEGDLCTIKLGYAEKGVGLKQLITGKVTSVKTERKDGTHKVFTVEGFDGIQDLTRGKKRRSWENIKDSDIANIIAGECGLGSAGIEDSGIIQPFVVQNNETDLAFLYERARRIGYEVRVEEKNLVFRKSNKKVTGLTLRWNAYERNANTLILQKCDFDASNMNMVEKVVVRSYDPGSASPIIAESSTINGDAMGGEVNAAQMAQTSGRSTVIQVSDQPVYSQEEAERLAESIMNQHADEAITGKGTCEGHYDLICGNTVKILDVGFVLEGEYYITSAKHSMKTGAESGAGYWTEFEVSRSGKNK